jgi:hypothetical protein
VSATHKIEIHQTGDQVVATVPAIDAVVTGATEEAALREAERAIIARMIEESEKRKRRRRGKGPHGRIERVGTWVGIHRRLPDLTGPFEGGNEFIPSISCSVPGITSCPLNTGTKHSLLDGNVT